MSRKDPAFGSAVRAACKRHGFHSTRHAQIKTGFDFSYISKMQNGLIPGMPTVIKWAKALGEPVNDWLRLAGYNPFPDQPQSPTELLQTEEGEEPSDEAARAEGGVQAAKTGLPRIPPALHAAIAAADSREEMIGIAFRYLWLRADEFGVRFGSHQIQGVEAKLGIIRAVEREMDIRLLPPDVV